MALDLMTETEKFVMGVLNKTSRPMTVAEISDGLKLVNYPCHAQGTVRNTLNSLIKRNYAIRTSPGFYGNTFCKKGGLAPASSVMTDRILDKCGDADIADSPNNVFKLEIGDWIMAVTIDPFDVSRKGLFVSYNRQQVPIVAVGDVRRIIEGVLERVLFLQERAIQSFIGEKQ